MTFDVPLDPNQQNGQSMNSIPLDNTEPEDVMIFWHFSPSINSIAFGWQNHASGSLKALLAGDQANSRKVEPL